MFFCWNIVGGCVSCAFGLTWEEMATISHVKGLQRRVHIVATLQLIAIGIKLKVGRYAVRYK